MSTDAQQALPASGAYARTHTCSSSCLALLCRTPQPVKEPQPMPAHDALLAISCRPCLCMRSTTGTLLPVTYAAQHAQCGRQRVRAGHAALPAAQTKPAAKDGGALSQMLPSAAAVPTCASRPAAIMWLMSGTASCPSTSSRRPLSVPSPAERAAAAADAVKVSSSAPATAAAADDASCSLASASLGDSASPSCSSAARMASSAACHQ